MKSIISEKLKDKLKDKLFDTKNQFLCILLFGCFYFVFGCYKSVGQYGIHRDYLTFSILITLILGCSLVIVVSYLALRKEWKLTKLFPLIAICLGIIYTIVLPTFSAPDEEIHFGTAYQISNKLLGVEDTGDDETMYMRKCDDNYHVTEFEKNLLGEFPQTLQTTNELELIEVEKLGTGQYIASIVPALGIVIGRLLHLNFGWITILGSFLNHILFVVGMTYAMKVIPFGKRILFVIALLPMTLQQTTSFSYDMVLILCTTIVVAITLKWKYEFINKSELVMFLLSAYMLFRVKNALYALVLLIPLMMFLKKEWFGKRNRIILMGGLFLLGVGGCIFLFRMDGIDKIYQFLITTPYIEYEEAYGHSVMYYIQHPQYFVHLFAATLKEQGVDYISQWGGQGLGLFEMPSSLKVRICIWTTMTLAMVRGKDENTKLNAQTRIACILPSIAIAFLCFVAMLYFWTPASQSSIRGMQGRYFIPVLIPFMIGIGYWMKPKWKIEVDKYFAIAVALLSFVVAFGVTRHGVILNLLNFKL